MKEQRRTPDLPEKGRWCRSSLSGGHVRAGQRADLPEKGRWCRSSHRGKHRPYRPCQQADRLHRAVRRVLPLRADLRPSCGGVRGAAEKAPRCANVRASPGAAQRIPAAAGKNPPSKGGPASHLASRRCPGSPPNAVCGQKPAPTSMKTEER